MMRTRADEFRTDYRARAPRFGKIVSGAWLGLSWAVPIAFLAWAVRLVVLEGYLYAMPHNFVGDFTRTAALEAPLWFTGTEIFYGPVFVLEYRFLIAPKLLSFGDFARLDFALFGIAFACMWLAVFGLSRARLAVFVLAAWLANHATVEVFSNTAHLEVLELTLLCAAILCAMRNRAFAAGGLLGLAAATKTLPGLFLPYLALKRQWRMLGVAVAVGSALFLLVCWLQQVSIWEGAYSLVYQGGNLTKMEYTEYEYTIRADLARTLAGDGAKVTDEQASLAISMHWAVALLTMAFAAWVLHKTRLEPAAFGLAFGLIAVVILVVAPSAHIPYYVFLLPGWTAALAELLGRRLSRGTLAMWLALITAYTFTGFDQPFFLAQRLFGFGIVVPQHWLAWHLPTVSLFLSIGLLASILFTLKPSTVTWSTGVQRVR